MRTIIPHAAVYDLYSMTGSDFEASQPRFGGYWEKDPELLFGKMSPHFGGRASRHGR